MTHNHCMMTLFPHSRDVGLNLGLQQTDLTNSLLGYELECHHHADEKKHLVGKHSLNTEKVSN